MLLTKTEMLTGPGKWTWVTKVEDKAANHYTNSTNEFHVIASEGFMIVYVRFLSIIYKQVVYWRGNI